MIENGDGNGDGPIFFIPPRKKSRKKENGEKIGPSPFSKRSFSFGGRGWTFWEEKWKGV
jgi:hypothetical protein